MVAWASNIGMDTCSSCGTGSRGVAMSEEKRYTLEEARQIIQAQLCVKMHGGHEFKQTIATTFMGETYLYCVRCSRCDLELVPRHRE